MSPIRGKRSPTPGHTHLWLPDTHAVAVAVAVPSPPPRPNDRARFRRRRSEFLIGRDWCWWIERAILCGRAPLTIAADVSVPSPAFDGTNDAIPREWIGRGGGRSGERRSPVRQCRLPPPRPTSTCSSEKRNARFPDHFPTASPTASPRGPVRGPGALFSRCRWAARRLVAPL